jgi:hypothetical protein
MGHEIQLDGAETSVLKAIGIGGGEVDGATLMGRCKGLDVNALVDTLKGLIDVGYVDADVGAFYSKEELEKATFRVNSGWSKDLSEAVDPPDEPKKSKRVRRE